MTKAVKAKLSEVEQHMKPYMDDMNATKALLASTMPCDHVCFDLAMATEYMLQSIESIGISTPVKNAKKKKPE